MEKETMSEDFMDGMPDGPALEVNDLPPLTMDQLQDIARDVIAQRDRYDDAKEKASIEYRQLEILENKIIAYMNKYNLKSQDFPGCGKFTVSVKAVVDTPKDFEQKKAFFEWLQTKGEVDFVTNLSVNHNTLQRIYNDEFELAAKEGRSVGFEIPGIGSAKKVRETLSIRKGKT
jgi:hypothetical protein